MPLSTINNKSIADGTIVATDILDGTISSSKLVSANIAGDRLAANTLSNTVFQTGSVENYMRGANLDFGMRNRIINGDMRIDQRNAGASITPTDGQYVVDRFNIRITQASKLTAQQNQGAVTPPAGFTNYLGVTSSSSYSVISSDNFNVVQIIEGLNIADLAWGTANARPVTLSFWVRSSLTGTFGGSLTNSALDRSHPFSYTISSANTWEQKSITITGDTTGTWLTTNGQGIRLWFGLGVGSILSGTAGSWSANYYNSATGATSIVGTNGATWYITGVQLEEGSVPTSFEYRQYGTELQLCQRYYETGTAQLSFSFTPVYGNGTWLQAPVNFNASKRAAPTVAFVSPSQNTSMSPGVLNTNITLGFGTITVQGYSPSVGGGSPAPSSGNYWYGTLPWTASIEL